MLRQRRHGGGRRLRSACPPPSGCAAALATCSMSRPMAATNVVAAWEARRFKPDVILVGHLIMSPGARLAGTLSRAPVVQYFHANEVGARPKLARFAYRSAAASIVVSSFTRQLVAGVAG